MTKTNPGWDSQKKATQTNKPTQAKPKGLDAKKAWVEKQRRHKVPA